MGGVGSGRKAATGPAPSPKAQYQRDYRARKKAEAERRAGDVLAFEPPDGAVDPDVVCDWITGALKVPTGPLTASPFRVPDWQRDWLREALAPNCREAGLSIARKNGKSGIVAAIILAALAGPLVQPNFRMVVASLRGNLAKELREAVMQTAIASDLADKLTLHRAPPPGLIYGQAGTRCDFLAADKATGHALGADIAIIDEAGLLDESKRSLWNAIYTSISGRDGRLWCISIQGDGPMFAEMEQRAAAGHKGLHWQKWAAPDDCRLDDRAGWRAANPALADGIKSAAYMEDAAAKAMASPGDEMFFRAYDLNQPVDPERQTIVSLAEYKECIADDAPEIGGEVIVGVDLGGSVSMAAACAYSPDTGAIRVWGAFGDDPELSVRARHDRMGSLYDRMRREEELKLYPGKVTPVVPFLRDVFDDLEKSGCIVTAIGADRYRKAEAEMAFREAGIPPARAFWRGQGASSKADGSHDVRAFQKAVAGKKLRTRGSTLLESAIANSVLRFDSSGNPALDKSGKNARIDALSASVIAVGIAATIEPAPLLRGMIHVV